MPTFRVISLGCPRNLVDAEVITGTLVRAGYRPVTGSPSDICIINTCAFIRPAREESVEAILEAVEEKKRGMIGMLIVCGCLPQHDGRAIAQELDEVDIIVGAGDFHRLPRLIGASRRRAIAITKPPSYLYDDATPRVLSTPPHYAYVKIAEGCSNRCSYCIISRLRGPVRSRSIPSVAREVKRLSRDRRLREIVLIGQDTTAYGTDRYGMYALPRLLRNVARHAGRVEWMRLMYTHPAHFSDDLIRVLRDEPKICRYVDLPVQHASDAVLRRMGRRTKRIEITRLIERLRREIPGITLRTSIIVGFPGETERDFRELLSFVREMRFERLGTFLYSREEGTAASRMKGQVPAKVQARRLDELMKLQQGISLQTNRRRIGTTVRVLIDEECAGGKGTYRGRTEGDAPEVDGSVFVNGTGIKVGSFCNAKITDALEYDLVGHVIKNKG